MADHLPPKGYSITRGPATNAAVQCQSCGAQGHWTYECPKKASSSSSSSVKPSTKLSRTQMLRFGIQKPLQETAPPKSDREVYDEQFKEAEKQLLGSDATTASAGKKRPREEATITAKNSEPATDAPNPLDQL